ncbi:hypothetical protein [Paenibacillus elgii]|uniref:hypothetical protein n=1 Tax=Paenibacillus elgii TaxID=189691 RepID=UPI000248D230|nr:hypothetical protein [Paenibacillus elgii]
MDLKTLMNTRPEELAKVQYSAFKSHVISILEQTIQNIYDENYVSILDKLVYSPAGDGYGCDNHFINFSYDQDNIDNAIDLYEAVEKLQSLKIQMTR